MLVLLFTLLTHILLLDRETINEILMLLLNDARGSKGGQLMLLVKENQFKFYCCMMHEEVMDSYYPREAKLKISLKFYIYTINQSELRGGSVPGDN